MREIKFRAWIKGAGIYTRSGPMTLDGVITNWSSPLGWADVEQFTGLKDKNGREIYFNDIVKDQFCFYKKVESYYCEAILIDHDVSYKLIEYGVMDIPGILSNIEVCGNIHENGDLLGRIYNV